MQLKQIISYLENIAPLSFQEAYDNCGLMVGNPEMEIKAALVCLDSTEETIDEAIQKKCNLVIAHHPVIFSGLKKLNGNDYVQRTIIKAIKNDIAIYAIHTNLDNVHNGVNAKICEKIGLKNCKILSPKKQLLRKLFTFCPHEKADAVRQALFEAGSGHIGNYNECSYNMDGFGTFKGSEGTNPYVGKKGKQHREKEIKIETIFPAHLEKNILKALFSSHPYEEVAYDIVSLENEFPRVGSGMIGELENPEDEMLFLGRLKKQMNVSCIRHTKLFKKKIKKVAVCGGSGSFLLKNAIAANADIFITSDFKYHQFFDAGNKIIVADIGHYESEQFTIELIGDLLKQKFSTFAVHFSKINTNPISYFYNLKS